MSRAITGGSYGRSPRRNASPPSSSRTCSLPGSWRRPRRRPAPKQHCREQRGSLPLDGLRGRRRRRTAERGTLGRSDLRRARPRLQPLPRRQRAECRKRRGRDGARVGAVRQDAGDRTRRSGGDRRARRSDPRRRDRRSRLRSRLPEARREPSDKVSLGWLGALEIRPPHGSAPHAPGGPTARPKRRRQGACGRRRAAATFGPRFRVRRRRPRGERSGRRRAPGRRRGARGRGRDRDERQRRQALAPQRRRAASPDRSVHRRTLALAVGTGHRRWRHLPRRRRLRKGGLLTRGRWARVARCTRPSGALPQRRPRGRQRVVGGCARWGAGVHLTSSPVDWYAARAAGIAAYVVLTLVVTLGLSMAGKARSSNWPKFAVEDVHRFGGLLVGFFVAIHVLTIAIDSYLPFSLTQLVVPFTSRYRPLWTGGGIAATELLVAIALTNHYRRRIPYRYWRRVHYLNFAVWTSATLHGIGSGTDRSAPWLLVLYAASAASVVTLVLWRALRPRGRVLLGGATAAVGVVVLLPALPTAKVHRRPWNAPRFHGTLTGQILADGGVSKAVISMAGNGRGIQNVLVRAD